MPVEQNQFHCPICKKPVLAVRTTPNRWLHGFLTLVTIWWAGVWYEAEKTKPPFRCQTCGRPFGPARTFSVANAILYSLAVVGIPSVVILFIVVTFDTFAP